MQIVCLRALINSDPCLWKTWKNRLRLDCDLGHVGEGSERTMHLRSRKAAEKHQHQQRQQQAPPPTPTPPCSGFWPHLLCLTVASCPRAWARDPAHAKPQPPSRHHRTLVVGSPTHAAPGQAMGLQRTRTQPHKDATGDNRRRTRRPLRATRPQSPHHRRQASASGGSLSRPAWARARPTHTNF